MQQVESTTRWDLKELRALVQQRHGRNQAELLSPTLNSIVYRQSYAAYHYREAQRELAQAVGTAKTEWEMVRLMFGEGDDCFASGRFAAEAHVIACLSNLHAVADTLGFAVHCALNLPASLKDAYARTVIQRVDNYVNGANLARVMREMLEHDDFRYLADVVNHSKHRRLVKPGFSVSFVETERSWGLKIEGFTHDTRVHASRYVEDFLPAEYARLGRLVPAVGRKRLAKSG